MARRVSLCNFQTHHRDAHDAHPEERDFRLARSRDWRGDEDDDEAAAAAEQKKKNCRGVLSSKDIWDE